MINRLIQNRRLEFHLTFSIPNEYDIDSFKKLAYRLVFIYNIIGLVLYIVPISYFLLEPISIKGGHMISFDKSSKLSLYTQLYEQLKQQILSEQLIAGQRLPATRQLASQNHLSRNTVISAYEQLVVEGYIKSVIGSGYYVEDVRSFKADFQKIVYPDIPNASKPATSEYRYDFAYGDLDYNCYQSKAWRNCLINAYDKCAAQSVIHYEPSKGNCELRQILARHLAISRGIKCQSEQIILTSGHQQSLNIIAELCSCKEWNFAMEDPGYNGTRKVMERNGFGVIPIPLEHDGISVSAVQPLQHTLLYVTPSHQFPMGSVLPIAKRIRLLQWAESSGSYIVEDDYDSELRYHNRPIPSLQSIDSNDRTIYLGTFSKSLSPDLRIAYIVLPQQLVQEYETCYPHTNCTVPVILQHALVDYIDSGEYLRHINTMRVHYRKKHDYILNYVKEKLFDRASLIGEDAGLHFILSVQTELSQSTMVREFAKEKVLFYPTEPYWISKDLCPDNQLLFGFSSIPLTKLPKAMETVSKVIFTMTEH